MSPLRLEIVTQERALFSGDVDMVVAPGVEGELGILPGHAPLLTALGIGPLLARRGARSSGSPSTGALWRSPRRR
jgi:ATP synthase F1 subcomplex epsilon subunit